MKKVNFNQLKDVKTPENWIENATKIPQKNKIKPTFLNPYIIASAACFIFCCALCAVVFLKFGVDMPNPIAPIKSSGTSVSEVTNSTSPSSNLSAIPTIPNPIINNIPTAAATSQQQTGSVQKSTNSSDLIYGTGQGTTGKNPTNSQGIVTDPESPKTTASSGNTGSTDVPEPSITNPAPPKTDPIEEITTSPYPFEPETPPIEEPCENFTSTIYFYHSEHSSGSFEEDVKYYCHIESENGESYSQMFSSAEIAVVTHTYEGFTVKYNPGSKGIDLNKGVYYLTFYDERGHSYKYSAYLGNQSVHIYL